MIFTFVVIIIIIVINIIIVSNYYNYFYNCLLDFNIIIIINILYKTYILCSCLPKSLTIAYKSLILLNTFFRRQIK